MDKKAIEHYRRTLQELTQRMLGDTTAVTEQILEGSGGQSGGGLSNAPMHLGDMGTDEYLHDLNATLLEHEEFLSGEVREALDRIEQGTFGLCETCGTPIAKERLEALPYARRCTPCAEAADTRSPANFNTGRPQRPQDTLAPQGEMDENGRRRTRHDNVESEVESPQAGLRVLSYARVMPYQPATAVVTAYREAKAARHPMGDEQQVSINAENVSALLAQVADLIGMRAQRRAYRAAG